MERIDTRRLRFTQVVAECGEPEVHLLFAEDRQFEQALRDERVMSVKQERGKKEFGMVGFDPKHIALLVFPKPLTAFIGARVIGIDYELIKKPRLRKLRSANVRNSSKVSRPLIEQQKRSLPTFKITAILTRVVETEVLVEAANQREARAHGTELLKTADIDFSAGETSMRIVRVKRLG